MASKKKASKKKASKKGLAVKDQKTGMATVDEQMAADAAAIADKIGAAETNKIRTGEKTFTMPDGFQTADPIELVVIGFTSMNKFYDVPYNEDNPTPPACFAIGDNPKQLVPSKNSPAAESKACEGCPNNEFGSAGAGKACKNSRLLIVMQPNADPEEGELMTLEVSPTALKAYDGYVASIAKQYNAPPVKVITLVGMNETKKHTCLTFQFSAPNPDYAAHYGRKAEAQAMLEAEPDVSGYEKPKPARRGRGR